MCRAQYSIGFGGVDQIRKVGGGIAGNIPSDSNIEGIIGQNASSERTTVGRMRCRLEGH